VTFLELENNSFPVSEAEAGGDGERNPIIWGLTYWQNFRLHINCTLLQNGELFIKFCAPYHGPKSIFACVPKSLVDSVDIAQVMDDSDFLFVDGIKPTKMP